MSLGRPLFWEYKFAYKWPVNELFVQMGATNRSRDYIMDYQAMGVVEKLSDDVTAAILD